MPQSRSIPACAGEPILAGILVNVKQVYPRVCGGTYPVMPAVPVPVGLSPRVQGNLVQGVGHSDNQRSIPACAGEPPHRQQQRHGAEVYPRVCGGTRRSIPDRIGAQGLSPRVRGNLTSTSPLSTWIRSIPACAGEPMMDGYIARKSTVYPRVCGGTLQVRTSGPSGRGLSPRVRGNRRQYSPDALHRRSIPACAGEPGWRSGRRR